MSLIAKVAERIPEAIETIVESGNELIIAPNIIAPVGGATQALPAAQAIIGLVCIVCIGLAVLSMRRASLFNQLKI